MLVFRSISVREPDGTAETVSWEFCELFNPFSANSTKWSNTLIQFVCDSRQTD